MRYRILAASIVVLGIGSMVTPIETSRAGGLISAPLAAGGVVRPSGAGARFAHLVPHGIARGFARHQNGLRVAGERDRRFPLSRGTDSPFYYPSEYAAPSEQPPYAYPAYPLENWAERSRPVATYQPGCRTDTQTVPSESGGQRTINITRCY